ncbi:MAG: hypothetical protein AAF196_20580, partial [Planctomycetota bacterium]
MSRASDTESLPSLPLTVLVSETRARIAFDALGIQTVREFLDATREEFLAVPGVGPKTFDLVHERVTAILEAAAPALDSPSPQGLMAIPAPIADETESSNEQSLPRSERSLVVDLLDQLGSDQREALRTILDRTATRVACLSRHFDVPPTRVDEPIEELRACLLELFPAEIRCLLACAEEELRVRGGLLTSAMVTPGRALGREIARSPRPHWALRLCAFLRPDSWHFEDGALIDCQESEWRGALAVLREELSRCDLPLRIENFVKRVRRRVPDQPWVRSEPLFRFALDRSGRASLRFRHGAEWIQRERSNLSTRLEWILRRSESSLAIDDLLFRLRDRYQRGSHSA